MPYSNTSELPKGVRHVLPEAAQNIYMAAFNNAMEQYKDPSKRADPNESAEDVARKVAWAAVKKQYTKGSDDKWHLK